MKVLKYSLLLLFAYPFLALGQSSIRPILAVNPIIGDESYLEAFGKMPESNTDNELRIATHLKFAEEVIRNTDCSQYTNVQQTNRMRLLDLLHEYIVRGEYPVNSKYNNRVPCFIDEQGTICAVGYLVEQSIGRSVAESINANYQYNYIKDIYDPVLAQWIEDSGLSLDEVAMIQPTYLEDKKRHSIYIGINAGMNYSGIREENFLTNHQRRIGPRMGVQIEKRWEKDFAIGAELIMQQKGYKHDIIFTDEVGNPSGELREINFGANYMSLPLKVGIHTNKHYGAYWNIGIIPSLLLNAELVYPEITVEGFPTKPIEVVNLTGRINVFDLAVMTEVGYYYQFYNRFMINLNLLYDRSITEFSNDDYIPDGKAWHNTFSATIGLKYRWSNKF